MFAFTPINTLPGFASKPCHTIRVCGCSSSAHGKCSYLAQWCVGLAQSGASLHHHCQHVQPCLVLHTNVLARLLEQGSICMLQEQGMQHTRRSYQAIKGLQIATRGELAGLKL